MYMYIWKAIYNVNISWEWFSTTWMPLLNCPVTKHPKRVVSCLSNHFVWLLWLSFLTRLWTLICQTLLIECPWLNSLLTGAFHMYGDCFFADLFFFSSLNSIIKKLIFAFLVNLINAGWWQIRKEKISTEGSSWVHLHSSFFVPFPYSLMRITPYFKQTLWAEIIFFH